MKVKMERLYHWECPRCGRRMTLTGNSESEAPYCPECWGPLDMSETEEAEPKPDYTLIHLHTEAMLEHLDKIEQEVKKGIKQGD